MISKSTVRNSFDFHNAIRDKYKDCNLVQLHTASSKVTDRYIMERERVYTRLLSRPFIVALFTIAYMLIVPCSMYKNGLIIAFLVIQSFFETCFIWNRIHVLDDLRVELGIIDDLCEKLSKN